MLKSLLEVLPLAREYSSGYTDGNKSINLAEGGLVMDPTEQQRLGQVPGMIPPTQGSEVQFDPVSGNEIPPGGDAKGVRDDIDAKVSEGEFVVPAHVVKFFGPGFFESMQEEAEAALQENPEATFDGELDATSEGDPTEGGPEEDPISEDDYRGFEDDAAELYSFAEGGLVTKKDTAATPFDPTNWSFLGSSYFDNDSGYLNPDMVETKRYYNKDGRMMIVTFIDGEPIRKIPEGFHPEGELPEGLDPTKGEAPALPPEERGDGNLDEIRGGNLSDPLGRSSAGGTSAANEQLQRVGEYAGFGGKNPYSMSKEEFQAAVDKAAKSGERAGLLAGIGGKLPGTLGIIGGIGGVALKSDAVSRLRALEQVARARGDSALADQIVETTNGITGGKPGYDMLASGQKRHDRMLQDYTSSGGVVSPFGASSGAASAGGTTSAASGGGGGDTYSPGGNTGGSSYGGNDDKSPEDEDRGGSFSNDNTTESANGLTENPDTGKVEPEGGLGFGSGVPSSGSQGTPQSSEDIVKGNPTSESPSLGFGDDVDKYDPTKDTTFGFNKGGLVTRKRKVQPAKEPAKKNSLVAKKPTK